MDVYKKWATAKEKANGEPVVRVGNLYIVGDIKAYTEISIVDSETGVLTGWVSVGHLSGAGNVNPLLAK